MQCPVCHAEAGSQSAFCANCGASLSAAVPPGSPVPPPAYSEVPPTAPPTPYTAPPYGAPPVAASSGLSANAASAIAYLTFIPAIIFLMIEPYNRIPIVRFHSFQSIGLAVVAFILDVAIRILLMPFGFVMYSLLQSLVSLGLFIVWLIVILKASKGEWFKLPIIGDLAMKQVQASN